MLAFKRGFPFYLFMAVLMIVVNVIGFAPSYFLKPLFNYPELPFSTHVHGILFTGWFVLFFTQVLLIRKGKIRIHKQLGIIGAILALFMFISGTLIIYFRTLEFTGTAGSLQNTALVVSGNIMLLFMFVMFTGLGIVYRERADWHKRFMLLACVSMMPQSLGRFGRLPIPSINESVPNEVFFGVGGMVFFILLIWTHELIQFKRLHLISFIGGPFMFAMIIFGAIILPGTGLMKEMIIWINS
ncbi:hypothetical protein [Gramella sp. KN1008]|uniref:hypothetical protein n=1 Tax=Gramella sp. KN1008 TaxID=2529298 RepID=UPI001039375C|nr:hypothetical protein [Gramella sp. KN1008]TBW29958.1 hypothetical protein EZJ28_00710 [Gramella sp. KN1008]